MRISATKHDQVLVTETTTTVCTCGCGTVLPLGRQFAKGHHLRSADWLATHERPRRKRCGQERQCLFCETMFWVEPNRAATQKVCEKPACKSKLRRKHDRPRNQLQARCIRWINERGVGFIELTRTAGLHAGALRVWFSTPGGTITRRKIERLANVFEISVDQAVVEAGDVTAEAKRAIAARKNVVRAHIAVRVAGKRRDRKISKALRGRTQSSDQVERRIGALRDRLSSDNALAERFRQQGRANLDRPSTRAKLALTSYLQHHPGATEINLRTAAPLTSGRLGVCIGEVHDWWNAWLAAHGRPRLGGRPHRIDQCQALRAYLLTQPTAATGQRPRRFWTSAPVGQAWSEAHAQLCPTLAAALNSQITPNSALEDQLAI